MTGTYINTSQIIRANFTGKLNESNKFYIELELSNGKWETFTFPSLDLVGYFINNLETKKFILHEK